MNHQTFSSKGQVVVTDTSTITGQFFAMQVIADAVVNSVAYETGYTVAGTSWADLTSIPAGTILFGRFNSITLDSGEVILHLA